MSALAVVALAAYAPDARGETKHACIAAADTAQKVRDEGRYRRAAEMFAVCARPECPLVIASSCARWQAELEAATPTFVASARDTRGGSIADVRMTVDGERVELVREGVATALDPGAHVFHFERDGYVAGDARVVLRAGEKDHAVRVVLRAMALGAANDVREGERAREPEAEPVTSAPRLVTTLSFVGAALLATGAATYFDIASRRNRDTAETYRASNPSDACASRGAGSAMCLAWSDAVDAQNRDAAWSRGLFVAAGGLAVASVVTWLVWPTSSAAHGAAPRLVPTASGSSVGAFAVGSF